MQIICPNRKKYNNDKRNKQTPDLTITRHRGMTTKNSQMHTISCYYLLRFSPVKEFLLIHNILYWSYGGSNKLKYILVPFIFLKMPEVLIIRLYHFNKKKKSIREKCLSCFKSGLCSYALKKYYHKITTESFVVPITRKATCYVKEKQKPEATVIICYTNNNGTVHYICNNDHFNSF